MNTLVPALRATSLPSLILGYRFVVQIHCFGAGQGFRVLIAVSENYCRLLPEVLRKGVRKFAMWRYYHAV